MRLALGASSLRAHRFKKTHAISSLIMHIDVEADGIHRFISCCMPHARYPHADSCDERDPLRLMLAKAQQLRYPVLWVVISTRGSMSGFVVTCRQICYIKSRLSW